MVRGSLHLTRLQVYQFSVALPRHSISQLLDVVRAWIRTQIGHFDAEETVVLTFHHCLVPSLFWNNRW